MSHVLPAFATLLTPFTLPPPSLLNAVRVWVALRTSHLPTLQRPADPRAIFVATPPAFRGGLTSPRDLELQLNAHFPEIPIFLEKPVATGAPWQESVGEAKEVAKRLEAGHKGVISIG